MSSLRNERLQDGRSASSRHEGGREIETNSTRVGLITIGQAPRTDIVPAIRQLVGNHISIQEVGCLDGMSAADIEKLRPGPGDYVLTSRLADGSSVVMARKWVEKLIEKNATRLAADGFRVIAVLCMAEFARVTLKGVTIVYPSQVFLSTVAGVLGEGQVLGVLFPLPEQRAQIMKEWQQVARRPIVAESASPYGSREAITRAAIALRDRGADLVVLDGAAYGPDVKAEVRRIANVPVIAGYSVIARVLAELA